MELREWIWTWGYLSEFEVCTWDYLSEAEVERGVTCVNLKLNVGLPEEVEVWTWVDLNVGLPQVYNNPSPAIDLS